MKRILFIVAVALTVASRAGADPPLPLPPQAVKHAAETGFTHAPAGQAIPVSVAAMSAKLGVPQAVLAGQARTLASRKRVEASVSCWEFTDAWSEWGSWPYEQRVTEYRYWCGYPGWIQTYRVSSAHLGSYVCSNDSPDATLISGGNGYVYSVVRTSGSFTCPTPLPYVSYHYSRWQDWRANTNGLYWWVDHS